jgi:hypothetical protein
MREMAGYGALENLADANALATMLKTLDRLSKPTIARVHGSPSVAGPASSRVATSPSRRTTRRSRFRRRSSA